MPYALFCQDAKISKAYTTEAEVWEHAAENGLVVDLTSEEEEPIPKRVIDNDYTIRPCDPDPGAEARSRSHGCPCYPPRREFLPRALEACRDVEHVVFTPAAARDANPHALLEILGIIGTVEFRRAGKRGLGLFRAEVAQRHEDTATRHTNAVMNTTTARIIRARSLRSALVVHQPPEGSSSQPTYAMSHRSGP